MKDERKFILNADQLRKGSHQLSAVSRQKIKRNEIYIVLDTYNIGSIFRLIDTYGKINRGTVFLRKIKIYESGFEAN